MFEPSLHGKDLQTYVIRQLDHFFPDHQVPENDDLFSKAISTALARVEHCFEHVALKAYNDHQVTRFSHLHADQYTVFLWFLSNSVWKVFEDESFASKFFCLNKALNGIMCMYDAELPDIFLILHGNGTVLGKAQYSDYFVCCHGCTVGAVYGSYPTIQKGVAMAPYSTIVGSCTVGPCSTIGTQALLRNQTIGANTLYYSDIHTGQSMTKNVEHSWAQSYYNVPIL